MNGPDVEGVLGRHERSGNHCRCGAFVAGGARLDSHFDDDVTARHRAHVAAAVLAEVRAWLEGEAVCQVVAYAVERAEKPKNATYDDVASAALSALAEQVAQVAPSRVPGEGS